jgi:nucleotide-binding universal stress UspA family protein
MPPEGHPRPSDRECAEPNEPGVNRLPSFTSASRNIGQTSTSSVNFMNGRLFVPLDGSPLAERALPYAAILASGGSTGMVLAHVLAQGGELTRESGARAALEATADRLRSDGLFVETVVSWTSRLDVADSLLEIAGIQRCALIAMSTHGASGVGRWLYGGVAEHILRKSTIPLLLVTAATDQHWPTSGVGRILVPCDGSARAVATIETLLHSLPFNDADVLLLHVVVPPRGGAEAYIFEDLPSEVDRSRESLERVAAALREKGWNARASVVLGSVAASVARIAREEEADVIAMATHGHSGVARLVLGSVAAETLHRVTAPLLLVRPGELQRAHPDAAHAVHGPRATRDDQHLAHFVEARPPPGLDLLESPFGV